MAERKKSIGRNDPCLCGSGLKYKKCCLGKGGEQTSDVVPFPSALPPNVQDRNHSHSVSYESAVFTPNPDISNRNNSDLDAALAEHEFESADQAQAFVKQFMQQRNTLAVPEFHGITPEQMHRVIHAPLDSPLLIRLTEGYTVDDSVPFVLFFNELLAAVGNKNFKPTQTGNLPRHFCRAVALKYWGEELYSYNTRFGGINSETDFIELNAFRHTCEIAGFLRKYRGKYIIGKSCQSLMNSGGLPAVYRGLFKVFNEEFNLGFADRYPQLALIQHSWAFSLYLLQQYGEEWKPTSFYEDSFLAAFPALVDSIAEEPWITREELIKRCYQHRLINHWMSWLGLAEVDNLDSKNPLSDNIRIRKTALADEVISFTF